MAHKRFCDFCTCDNCVNGGDLLHHAKTEDGRWICDVCYRYDECVKAQRLLGIRNGPCNDLNCAHRPKIVSGWEKWE